MRTVLVIAILLAGLGAGEADPPTLARRVRTVLVRPAPPVAAWERDLEVVLQKEVDFTWEDTPLATALEELRRATGAAIVIDAGVDQEALPPITLRARDMTLRTALRWLERICRLETALVDGAILVGEDLAGELRHHELRAHLLGPVCQALAGTGPEGTPVRPTAEAVEALVRFCDPRFDLDDVCLASCPAIPWGQGALYLLGDRSQQGRLLVLLDHLAAGILPAAPEEPWLDALIAGLDGTRTEVAWEDEELAVCVSALQQRHAIPFILDPEVLAAGVRPVTLRLKGATLRQVLDHLCRQTATGWQLLDEAVFIASSPAAGDTACRLYDLSGTPAARRMAPLVELITRTCHPRCWEQGGRLLVVGPRLFVRTSPAIHRDIARLVATFHAEPRQATGDR